jgi:flagellar biosynthesis/type III secretory pathway protein FliH
LRINPDDLSFVEEWRPELFEKFKTLKSIVVNPDSTIQRGGCLLETPCGDIDARIETQLEIIGESLKSAFSGCADE